jgi:acyl-homoserine lactone synthase
MLRIIYEHEDRLLMERIWSFRHMRFVEQLGWENLRRPDRRERDCFDNKHAIHIVLILHDEIIGYSRLLPTTIVHLAAEICPDPHANLPSGPHTYEWSRCAVALDAPSIAGVTASDMLMTGVLECLLHLGAKKILFVTYPSLVQMMRRRGYSVKLLATFAADDGTPTQIASARVSAKLLGLHRRTCGITGPLVSLGRAELSFSPPSSAAA